MNEDAEMVKDGFADLHMTRPAETIIAAGDARRRRNRLASVSAPVVAIAAAAAVLPPIAGGGHGAATPRVASSSPRTSLPSGASPSSGPSPTPGNPVAPDTSPPGTSSPPSAQTSSHVDVDTAGFSVLTRADGSIRLTLSVLADPAMLQRVLASAGAPARIDMNEYCDAPQPSLSGNDDWRLKAIVQDPDPTDGLKAGESVGGMGVVYLYPAELRPGWKYQISIFNHHGGGASIGLLPPGKPVTCHT